MRMYFFLLFHDGRKNRGFFSAKFSLAQVFDVNFLREGNEFNEQKQKSK